MALTKAHWGSPGKRVEQNKGRKESSLWLWKVWKWRKALSSHQLYTQSRVFWQRENGWKRKGSGVSNWNQLWESSVFQTSSGGPRSLLWKCQLNTLWPLAVHPHDHFTLYKRLLCNSTWRTCLVLAKVTLLPKRSESGLSRHWQRDKVKKTISLTVNRDTPGRFSNVCSEDLIHEITCWWGISRRCPGSFLLWWMVG